tara:strand:- start:456 stop:905 length:450 start_codon:yes stop_codon:yes gene_type:complete
MEYNMGIKVERLADRAVEAIQDELNGMSQDDLSTFDHERFINETIGMLMPTGNWEFIEFLQDDTDLGFESDIVTADSIGRTGNIFRFIELRIFEEIERRVLFDTQGWFDLKDDPESNSFPDDHFDDGWALASAGFGTDEDFGTSASDML